MASTAEIPGLAFKELQYGAHDLQRLGVWLWKSAEDAKKITQSDIPSYWIVFLHGGAWRDPRRTYNDFVPTIKAIMSSPNAQKSSIRGFASIDYRLSPHPDFPQDSNTTPANERREAQHPDHLHDVTSGLAFLDNRYGMGQSYILVGHSAGATLACQLIMGQAEQVVKAPLPRSIVGISGIYDLGGLVSRMDKRGISAYRDFVGAAFGSDEKEWAKASPALHSSKFAWQGGMLTFLAWSKDDTLIDEPEIDAMAAKLTKDEVLAAVLKDCRGEHDQIWEDGNQVAQIISHTIQALLQL